jgi:hypothetical protein
MTNFLKFLSISIIIALVLSLGEMWYNMFLIGRYYEHATFFATAMVGFIIPIAVICLTFFSIKSISKLK